MASVRVCILSIYSKDPDFKKLLSITSVCVYLCACVESCPERYLNASPSVNHTFSIGDNG